MGDYRHQKAVENKKKILKLGDDWWLITVFGGTNLKWVNE